MKKLKKKINPFFNPRDHYLCKCGAVVAKNYECPLCKIRSQRAVNLYIVPGKDKLKIFKKDREKIIAHWNLLNPKERRIMRLRYGIGDNLSNNQNPHSLKDVGKTFGTSRQRIHQIQKAILNKIDNLKRSSN